MTRRQKLREDFCIGFGWGHTAVAPPCHTHQSHLGAFGKLTAGPAPGVSESVELGAQGPSETYISIQFSVNAGHWELLPKTKAGSSE